MAAILSVVMVGSARLAMAHPLGNFSINHYARIEAGPAQTQILYVVDMAEVPTFQLKGSLDANGDGKLGADELDPFAKTRIAELARGLTLKVNGAPATLATRSPKVELLPGQGGLDTLRLSFWADAAAYIGAEYVRLEFSDSNDLDRLGWREIVALGRDGVILSDSNVSERDLSNELRAYPDALLNNPPRQTSAMFSAKAGGASGQAPITTSAGERATGITNVTSQLAALVGQSDLTPTVIAVSMLTAFVLGALHALEPGHGKSVAAAYLVGSRATPYHAVLLGSTVTITHTASVFLMGLVTLTLSAFILPEQLLPWLALLSALIVIGMGVNMIVQAIRQARAGQVSDHVHEFDPNTSQLTHSHGGKSHTHVPPSKMNARNVLMVGVSGGLVPCPAALIVLLSAIAIGRVGFGMFLIVVFSLGLAGVLMAVSLAVVYSKRMIGRSAWAARFQSRLNRTSTLTRLLPFFSGAIVIAAGVLLLYYAAPLLRIWRQ